MKILIVSESIDVEDSSASKGRVALIQNLDKIGFEIKVLHYSHKEIQLSGIDCVLIKEDKAGFYFLMSRFVRVMQRVLKKRINDSIEAAFGFSFTHTNDSRKIAKAINSHLGFNPDIVLTLSKGSSFRPHRAMLYLPQLHSKWMAYIHDPYPFNFYPEPFTKFEAGHEKKEQFMTEICKKAAFVSFPSLLLKEWMQQYFPSIQDKSVIIPHQINRDFKKQPLPDYFVRGQFSLLHAGNLLKERTPEFLVKGYLKFLEKNESAQSDSKLYLIGKNFYYQDILNPYKDHPNIVSDGYTDYDTVQTLENEVSVNIILESISGISPFLPGKFPNHLKANKPIIALGPKHSEVRRLLGEKYPYWAEADNADTIESIITALYRLWQQNPNQLQLNRPDLVRYCSETALKEVFETIELK